MRKRPTIREVAVQAEVSKTTVGYVLSDRMDVAIPDATRARVFAAAKELGYRRNGIARSFVTGKSHNIGVIVSYQGYVNGCQDAFVSRILYGLQETCAQNQHGMLLSAAKDETGTIEKQINSLLEQKVGGLIVVGHLPESLSSRLLAETSQEHVPLVAVDDRSVAGTADCIFTDDETGARLATRHLISCGHRRVAHLRAGTSTTTAGDREAGYCAALNEAGMRFDSSLAVRGSFVPHEAAVAAADLLNMQEPPDGVLADSDYLAAAVLQVVLRRGLRVPDDIALVGYGDLQIAEWFDLTTIKQNPEEMGRRAATIMFERIDDPDGPHREVLLPVELVVRGSCGVSKNT